MPEKKINIISRWTVENFLGREPTPEDLDKMAKEGIFLSKEDRVYYDIHGTFVADKESGGE